MKTELFLLSIFLLGAGPILVDTDSSGRGVTWQDNAVRYNPESGAGGGLGRLANDEAQQLLRDLFADWQQVTLGGVAVTNFSVVEGSGLGEVDASNLNQYFSYCPPDQECPGEDPPFVLGSARTGSSPILFDSDGAITDMIQGEGAKQSILGFAGPRVVERVNGLLVITEGQAVLNGLFIDCPVGAAAEDPCQNPEVDLEEFEGAIFHELGHFIGLDHSQVNLSAATKALQGDTSEVEAIPTMFPLLVDGVAQRTPHFDDIVSLASLYPSADFSNHFCTLEGIVYQSDGVTELQGVNVVTRRVDNPLLEAESFVSGQLYVGDEQSCDIEAGGFVLGGLSPGVAYTLEVEKISRAFTGGSSIEPCDPPQSGFEEKLLPGTFSCTVGGETITIGTAATTQIVTTKGLVTTTASNSGGGCSLIP